MIAQSAAEAAHLGSEHLRAGRHAQAIEVVLPAISREPDSADLHAILGGALLGMGRTAQAERSFRDAIALRPDFVEAINDLANALRHQARIPEAIACYRDAVRLRPELGVLHQNLGTALAEERNLREAEASLREAARLQPASAAIHHDLAVVLHRLGEIDQAAASFQQALRLNPPFTSAKVGLARCWIALGQADQAAQVCTSILRVEPDSHDAAIVSGIAYQALGSLAKAADCYRQALKIKPDSAEASYQLATIAMVNNRLDEAAEGFRESMRLQPNFALAENNLGNVFLARACLKDAIGCFERARELDPGFVGAHSNVLFAMNFLTDVPAPAVFEAHLRWGQTHADPLLGTQRAGMPPGTERRLRVGYVSGDFRAHSVSLFIEPVLESHDRRSIEIFCYADVAQRDAVTARLEALSEHWISLVGMSDERAAARIRQDGIDILVDLAGHTGPNRLLAFARRSAPVQVTWLGYPNTTGMRAMDFRLTDSVADPPGLTEHLYSETLVRLPNSLWCYRPDGSAPEVNPLPADRAGHVTFGSFNNFAKVTFPTRELWAQLLRAIPGSRLRVVGVPDGSASNRLIGDFSALGVDPSRLDITPRVSRQDFFRQHHAVDIALDPCPYQGGTTTCESMWMGLPVISLAGTIFASRAGASLLSSVGLHWLVAQSPAEFIQIGVRLANDLAMLAVLRQGMRDRMRGSPLMDEQRFTSALELAYRHMWRSRHEEGRG